MVAQGRVDVESVGRVVCLDLGAREIQGGQELPAFGRTRLEPRADVATRDDERVAGVEWESIPKHEHAVALVDHLLCRRVAEGAHFGDRERVDRSIVNGLIGHRERSGATLAGSQSPFFAWTFLREGPCSTIRWALWSRRSQIASAMVGSPT
jgi:hypothetical protein